MLKKFGLACVLSGVAISAMASTPKAAKECQVTIAVSHYWADHNITFENLSGEAMGLYRSGGPLIIHSKHSCEPSREPVFANPTLGLANSANASGYPSARNYPMDSNIVISFPDDFPDAPVKPEDNVK